MLPGDSSTRALASLDRGLAVLERLSDRGDARLAELARELGSSRTTMFRVLETLRARGFVEHVPASHTYRLGPGARVLASSAVRSTIVLLAEAPMAELRNQTGETVNLVRVHGARLRYEAVLEGRYSLRSLPAIGQPVAAHCSALGKAILAGSPEPTRRLLLGPEPYSRLTANTITGRKALDEELAAVGQRGYALDEEENEPGLTCVAAVIRGPDDRPIAAISISGLSERMKSLDLAAVGLQLRGICNDITASLRA